MKNQKLKTTLKNINQPFYSSQLAHSFLRVGLPRYIAYQIAHNIWEEFLHKNKDESKLYRRACAILKEKYPELLDRYRNWHKIAKRKKPLIIFVGGSTGVGTSTLAVKLGSALDINHIVSTDAVREIVRKFLPVQISPLLHVSTYESGAIIETIRSYNDAVVFGFVSQSKKVIYGLEPVIKRSVKERQDIIIEGIHLIPGQMEFLKKYEKKAKIIQIILDVDHVKTHLEHFSIRHFQNSNRPKTKYLKNFKEIRLIRDFLVHEAEENNVSVFENYNLNKVERQIVNYIYLQYLAKNGKENKN
ncbi:MAG: hypothetical protein ABII08_02925 [Candidatus Beckwithbacteria bacterium]